MANISVTYSFSNGTTADATQVNQNFSDIINGTSDSTKDFSIAALTCAGTATFNGNVILGNASGDDVTFTGSLASSIAIKTTGTYNIGSATLAPLSIYLSENGSNTVRLLGLASSTTTWTFTFPTNGGTSGYMLETDGSGTTSWASPYTIKSLLDSRTTGDTLVITDAEVQYFNPASDITVTLPSSAARNMRLKIFNTSTNKLSINSGGGNAVTNITAGWVELWKSGTGNTASDWSVIGAQSRWISYTPTVANISLNSSAFYWRRVGDSMEINFRLNVSGSSGSTASFTLPQSLTIDTNKIATSNNYAVVGEIYNNQAGTFAVVICDSVNTDKLYFAQSTNFEGPITGATLTTTNWRHSAKVTYLPISGWNIV